MKATEKQKEHMREYYQQHKQDMLQKRKSYHQENKERIKERTLNYISKHQELVKGHQAGYRAKWYLKKKIGILSHYSSGLMKCAHCGFDDIRALSIDHINGGGAPHRKITGNDVYGWLKRNGFPEGYQVLCMNCQLIKRQVNRECYIR